MNKYKVMVISHGIGGYRFNEIVESDDIYYDGEQIRFLINNKIIASFPVRYTIVIKCEDK